MAKTIIHELSASLYKITISTKDKYVGTYFLAKINDCLPESKNNFGFSSQM